MCAWTALQMRSCLPISVDSFSNAGRTIPARIDNNNQYSCGRWNSYDSNEMYGEITEIQAVPARNAPISSPQRETCANRHPGLR